MRTHAVAMSFAQQRIWLAQRLAGSAPLYNIPIALRLTGRLDRAALRTAVNDVIARHEVLRTIYAETAQGPYQLILDAATAHPTFIVTVCDERHLAEAIAREGRWQFDLSAEIPVRVVLLASSLDEHVLLIVLHHICFDGWSIRPFLEDLQHAYAARAAGLPPAWPELPVQYSDFCQWQRELLGSESDPASLSSRQIAYWGRALSGIPEQLWLPTDRGRSPSAGFTGGAVPIRTSARVHRRLTELARAEHCTVFMVIHAALAALLARLGAGTDIPIGTPVAGRPHEKLKDLVGCFNNIVVLRSQARGDPSFRGLLRQVRAADLAALSHQDVPFERVVAALNPARSAARHPLFQVMLVAEANVAQVGLSMPGIQVEPLNPPDTGMAKLDLTVGFAETYGTGGRPVGITGLVEYAAALFDRTTAETIAARLTDLLSIVAERPDTRLSQLGLLGDAERRRLLHDWNATAADLPAVSVPELIETQAARMPAAIAVESGTTRLTYAELNARANQLACHLGAMGAGPETVIAVMTLPSELTVVALLAVLKAGAAYLPVDAGCPKPRLQFILKDAGSDILLTAACPDNPKVSPGIRVLRLDDPDTESALAEHPAANPIAVPGGSALRNAAYVIYTSGSTGVPKGVVVEHRSLANYVSWAMANYHGASGIVSLHSPVAFDMSITSIFVPLVCGGRIRVGSLESAAAEPRATLIKLTPSHLPVVAALGGDWYGAEELIIGGEALAPEQARGWRSRYPNASLVNEYGPTEATVGCIAFRIAPDDGLADGLATVPIGRPISNARIYILDDSMNPVPTGVPGELCIAGIVLARGYLGRADLTAERFVPCPFGAPGERMYRTGDLARWRTDGNLEFIGRMDRQVKLRGYRVEPGEVEATLRGHPAAADVAAVVREDSHAEKHLVAYIAARHAGEPTIDELRSFASERLPRYMVPSGFVIMAELPRGPSGKLDAKALPPPVFAKPATAETEPRSAPETMLCELFVETLGVVAVGIHDNFFEIGGTSVKAAKMLARLAARAGYRVPLQMVYANPTVAGLVTALDNTEIMTAVPAVPAVEIPVLPPRSVRQRARAVLVTGATGFFGPFLLHEILGQAGCDVYCLVRAPTAAEGQRRIAASLAACGRSRTDLAERVSVIVGDVAQPRLGLDDATLDRLSSEIDTVYHNAAVVDALLPYSAMERTNVASTQALVRFATTRVLKKLHYVSSASADALDSGGSHAEVSAYAATKWLAERLIIQARAHGVPASAFRLPRLAMDGLTGQWSDRDIMARLLRLIIVLGTAPDLELDEPWIPADVAARLMVGTVADQPDGGLFTMTARRRVTLGRIVDIAGELGCRATMVSRRRWLRMLAEYDPAEHDVIELILGGGSRVPWRGAADPVTAPHREFCPISADGVDDSLLRAYLASVIAEAQPTFPTPR